MKCYWFCIFDKENPNDNKKTLTMVVGPAYMYLHMYIPCVV